MTTLNSLGSAEPEPSEVAHASLAMADYDAKGGSETRQDRRTADERRPPQGLAKARGMRGCRRPAGAKRT